jgi:NADH-quinone oxidoreductase subunit L
MMVGTIAIAGIPPFSGFFSKDEILAHVYEHNKAFWVIAVIGAMFTSFYMFRMMYLTFNGSFRGTTDQEHHLHESPASMTIPLIALAVLSALGGLIGIPAVLGGGHWLENFLAPVFEVSTTKTSALNLDHTTEYVLMSISVTAALLSMVYAYVRYVKQGHIPASDRTDRGLLARLSYNKFYIDEVYNSLITRPLDTLSGFFYKTVDKAGIDGIVNGFGKGAVEASKSFRLLQTGMVGFYIFMMVAGILALLFYSMYKI